MTTNFQYNEENIIKNKIKSSDRGYNTDKIVIYSFEYPSIDNSTIVTEVIWSNILNTIGSSIPMRLLYNNSNDYVKSLILGALTIRSQIIIIVGEFVNVTEIVNLFKKYANHLLYSLEPFILRLYSLSMSHIYGDSLAAELNKAFYNVIVVSTISDNTSTETRLFYYGYGKRMEILYHTEEHGSIVYSSIPKTSTVEIPLNYPIIQPVELQYNDYPIIPVYTKTIFPLNIGPLIPTTTTIDIYSGGNKNQIN